MINSVKVNLFPRRGFPFTSKIAWRASKITKGFWPVLEGKELGHLSEKNISEAYYLHCIILLKEHKLNI